MPPVCRKIWAGLNICVVFSCIASPARGAHPLFRVGNEQPQRVEIVAAGVDASTVAPLGDSPMLARLAGITGDIPADRLGDLTQAIGPALDPARLLADATPLCSLRMTADGQSRALEVLRLRDGALAISDFASAEGARERTLWRLKPGRFESIAGSALGVFSEFEAAPPIDTGRIVELERPFAPGRFTLDAPTIRSRLVRGASGYEPTKRDLAEESMSVRLPRRYDGKNPQGLLVWVDPMDLALRPAIFDEALDRAGVVMIGAARSGNTRPVIERLQLALDAVETARARFHIDESRIYASGMSGGGKMATMLWACFPEVFTGAIPIVGLVSYRAEPAGAGKSYPPEFVRPSAQAMTLIKPHRLAPITGDKDFNAPPMRVMAAGLKNDGFAVKLFEDPELGHDFPPPALFAAALDWVDQPQREARQRENAAGESLWRDYESKFGAASPPPSAEAHGALIRITREAPWTAEAWRAVGILRGPS